MAKKYTQEEAFALGIEIDLFGEEIIDKERNMKDYFIVPPFSIINTMEKDWVERKRRWLKLIGENGESRQNKLMPNSSKSTKADKRIKDFKNGVSILDPCLAEVLCKWFSQPNFKVFDPFAGDSVFGYVASYFQMNFTGVEIRQEQVEINNERIKDFANSIYLCNKAQNIDDLIVDETQDFIFTCPPYMDLEIYSELEDDLSNKSTKEFYRDYAKVLSSCFNKLKSNRFTAVVVSEVRDKKTGWYKCLVSKTIEIMTKSGFKYYNEIILVNSVGTLPLRAGRWMNSTRKVGSRHQNVLIFYKGDDANDIKKVFPKLMEQNKHYK